MKNTFVTYIKSPLSLIKLTATENAVNSVLFVFPETETEAENSNDILEECKRQLKEYFAGKRKEFDLPIHQEGTEFQQRVWNELMKIPYGETISYHQLAERLGDVKSIRAAGSANGGNKISIIVPCHRVIGADGSLTGYAGGLWRKEWLLNHEAKHSGKEMQMGLFG